MPRLFLILWVPLPDPAAVPWLMASVIIHWIYFYLLNVAYRLGDLSLIYPISRGLAPVLVAFGAQLWIGERPKRLRLFAAAIVAMGIIAITASA